LFTAPKTKNRFGEEAVWRQSDDIKRGNCVKWVLILVYPQFLKKSPSKIRPLERRGDLLGFRVEKFGSPS